jgi:hypothetical protein
MAASSDTEEDFCNVSDPDQHGSALIWLSWIQEQGN